MVRDYIIPLIPTRRLKSLVLKYVNRLFGKMPTGKYFRIVNLKKGIKIKVDIGEYIGSHLYYFKEFERDTYESLQKLMIKGKCFFDIGGNVGLISLMVNQICAGDVKIYIFEPAPDNFKLLKDNIKMNGIDNAILNNVAVSSDSSGTLTLNLYEDQAYNSVYLLDRVPFRSKIKVPVLSIDGYIEKQKISPDTIELIKIDVEGYEYNVFKGALKLLTEYSPKILCEISYANLAKSGLSPYDVISSLLSFGYRCYVYENKSFRDIINIKNSELGYKYRNFFFSKDKIGSI
jgi:FkbM family methyltransferase